MMGSSRTYLPAAGHDWSLPLYDPIVKLLGGDAARKALLEQAALRPGQRVLDVGCGTGTLATLIKQLYPDVEVVGLDPDPKALARARRKAALPPDEKGKTLRAIRRVVKPGGEFYMLDLEGREDGAHGFLAHLLHSSDRMKDNSESRVLSLMRQAGFADPKKVGRRRMLFGGVAYYRAGAE